MGLIENLYSISSIKEEIRSAIEEKGVDMTGLSFADYPGAISTIQTGGTYGQLYVTENGIYYPDGSELDAFDEVLVSVIGFTEKDVTEGLSVINLSNSATTVCGYAFTGNTYLQTVNLSECSVVNEYAFAQCRTLQTVNLPVCKNINSNAFISADALSQISLPECVFISSSAFQYCNSLTELNLPLVSELGSNAFRNCNNLTFISLPECITLRGNTFSSDYKLSEVYIPVCGSIDGFAFNKCSDLEKLTVCLSTYIVPSISANVLSFTKIASGTGSIYVASDMYSRFTTANVWSDFASQVVSVEQSLPVLSYSDGLVFGLTVTINNGFQNYLSVDKSIITSVNLPNCTFVMNSCFSYMSLSGLSLPVCENIGSKAFEGTSIYSINLPECKILDWAAFKNCNSTRIINIPKCESVMAETFTGCVSLESIDLPVCRYIGDSAFSQCNSLSEISLPVCENIGRGAFDSCVFSTINLPVCSYIGNLAFKNMYNTFKELILGYSDVVKTGNNIFQNANPSIYVPASLVEAYKVAEFWSTVSGQIFPIE